ncbi:AAA domain (dynein-related subfamily) [Halalkalicoccus paucihalophilus]|uniref:AAA domain (Dynein-related subfamily) n=2 Tax=Halalkalicoccus paucihalophilus TaxID=1008153 RepID=A0A151AFZ8_9EURY|nr:AAA domain (dynein-related subfamily) [Halalkalicoccus paucihalophilus]
MVENTAMDKEERQLERFVREHGEDGATFAPTNVEEAIGGSFVETDEIESIQDRVRNWLDVPRPVHIVGPTGCGKTALALSIAAARDQPVVWVNGDELIDTGSLVGEHAGKAQYKERDNFVRGVMKKKSIIRDRWVDNPLSVAVQNGATLVYNEFSRTKPAAHNVLLSVFEEGVLDRPGQRGEKRIVEVDPEFRAIFTSNSTEYAGVHRPQDALLDRFIGVHLDYYERDTEIEIVAARIDDLDEDTIEEVVDIVRDLRDRLELHVGTRAAVMIAEGLVAFGEDELVEVCVDVLGSKAESFEDVEEIRDEIEDVAS